MSKVNRCLALLLFLAANLFGAPRSVMEDGTGKLLAPANFFFESSNALNAGISRLGLTNLTVAAGTNLNGFTLFRQTDFSNALSGYSLPAAGMTRLFGSNNSIFLLKNDGTLVDLAQGGGGGGSSTNLNWGKTVYVDAVNGNNTTGQRGNAAKPFLTITAAKAVALAGDSIFVRSGVYNENDLLKGGVAYFGDPNAHIRYVADGIGATDSYAVFDDRDGASTNTIVGFGDISFYGFDVTGDAKGIFHLEQSNSIVTLNCNRLLYAQHTGNADSGVVDVRNCKWFSVQCNEISDGAFQNGQVAGVYWEKGDGYVKCNRIVMDEGPAIYCAEAAASGIQTNTFTVDVDYIRCAPTISAPAYPVHIATTNANCRIVLKGKYWSHPSSNPALYRQDGNATVSVDVDYTESAGDAYVVTGGSLEIGGKNIVANGICLQVSGGRMISRVARYSHLIDVTSTTREAISLIGGTNIIFGGVVYRTNGPGIKISGSQSTRLVGMTVYTFNTSGSGDTNSPVECKTNGLTLQNMTLNAPVGVASVKGTNVINPIFVEGTLQLNTAPGANTTLTNGIVYLNNTIISPVIVNNPLTLNGAIVFPVVTNTTLTVNRETNAVQQYNTNADYTVTFTGTPLNGVRGEYRVWNTGNTQINLGWPASYSLNVAAGITSIPLASNSLTRIMYFSVGGSNFVEIAGKDQYIVNLGPTPSVGQGLKIISLSGGPGGSMVLSNLDSGDAAFVNGTAISDSFSFSNVTASATAAGVTWTVVAGTDPDPDKVSMALGAASATVAGTVTAQAQTFGGAKTWSDSMTASSTIVHNGGDQYKILTNSYSGLNVFLDLSTNTMQFLLVTNNFTLILTNQNVGQSISFTMYNTTATNCTITLPAVQIYGSGISNVVVAAKRLKTAWQSQDTQVTNVSAAFAQQKN